MTSEPRQESTLTATTARRMAHAVHAYLTAEADLAVMRGSKDEPALCAAAERWADAADEITEARKRIDEERKAADLTARQADIFVRNLSWLKRHHPDDPRIPQIEASLAGGV